MRNNCGNLKHKFIENLNTESTDDSIDTSSTTSASSDLDLDGGSLIDLSPMEVTSKTFVGLTNSANVQSDPKESMPATPVDSESNKTMPAANKSHQDIDPPPLMTLDSPNDVDKPCAMIDTGAKALATNPLHRLHKPFFFTEHNPCPVKMCGATAKDMLISPVAKGFLRIPAITLP